jgi:xylulokinase
VCLRPSVRQRFEPAGAKTDVYGLRHARFKALYASLRACFAGDRSTQRNG